MAVLRFLHSDVFFWTLLVFAALLPGVIRWKWGDTPFTRRLYLVQQFFMGALVLLLACLPNATFTDEGGHPAPILEGRVEFALIGLLFIGLGIWRAIRHRRGTDWNNDDP